ncbi:ABC-type phosphate transport system, periplasmic component [Nostoc flagelliforme CCNUN1]|uniref:ABC-type phosphate transport system, periplasmic component n=2 Tax=Nostoc flagelliforme TaxID=1306274 RepID=A0A2K8SS71_9NOSO|nr:ABC-type phosphate transport system, periplasmic component [Nostoc flagelliforme CCNUN1]
MAANLLVSEPMLAQSKPETPSLTLPQTVQNGTPVRIDGSSSLAAINQSMKENFEKQFSGAKLEVAANGTDTALKDLLDGKIDIAAMGRGLTPAEKAQGLEQNVLHREKIAIVVGADNPFKGNLTSRQFARIFRGQITNWSQLGGPSGKIRLIDHPNTSETRNTFRTYPAFKTARFATGANATQLTENNTAEIIRQLGKDGISYVLANQVSKLKGVRVLQLDQALPDDDKYPFSQPLVYVYKKNPSSSIVEFIGFIASSGKNAVEQGRTAEAEAIATNVLQPVTASPGVQTTSAATPSPSATSSAFAEQPFVAPATSQPIPIVNRETPFWLLLPLFFAPVAGVFLWWVLGKRPLPTEKTDNLPESDPRPPSTEDGEMAVVNASTSSSINGAMEEQPVPQFQEQESPDRTPFNIYTQTESDLTQNATQETSNLVREGTTGASNSYEDTTSGVANGSENNNLGAAALTNGAALSTGIGAASWSAFTNKETDADAIDETVNQSDYTEINNLESDSDEIEWDIEAPAAVVNTSYPHLPNIPEEVSDVELPLTEETAPLPDVLEIISDFGYWDADINEDQIDDQLQAELNWLESITSTEDTDSVDELALPESGEVAADVEPSALQTSSLVDLPELSEEDLFNVVADAAEPTVNLPEEESQAEPTVEEGIAETDSTDLVSAAALAAGVGIAGWTTISASDAQRETDTTVENVPIAAETAVDLIDAEEESSIVLTLDTYTSAHVSWEISEAKKAALRQQGGSQLVVRLYDATGIDLSYQSPHLVQEYECDETAHDRLVEIPLCDRDYIAEIGYIADGDAYGGKLRWLFIARSAIVRVFSPVLPDPVVDRVAIADETDIHLLDAQEEIGEEQSSIVLTPHTYTSAHVSWEISETKKAALHQEGGSQLVVRLYDVTGIDLSYQSPHLVQEYECDETAHDRLVEIPLSDRDYIAEIGYVAYGEYWLFIARSAIVRVFSPVSTDPTVEDVALTSETPIVHTDSTVEDVALTSETPIVHTDSTVEDVALTSETPIVHTDSTVEDVTLTSETPIGLVDVEEESREEESSILLTPRTPKWAYVSWHISKAQNQALRQQGGSQLVVRLYDVTGIDLSYQSPQLVQQYECEEVARDRFVAIPVSDRDYMVEIGYIADGDGWLLIARSPNIRVFSRSHEDFWFVADTELIIHGATQPNTSVNIGGHSIKIKPDGTFHLRLPFSDGLMDYLITVAADGESTRTIHKKFSQETSES